MKKLLLGVALFSSTLCFSASSDYELPCSQDGTYSKMATAHAELADKHPTMSAEDRESNRNLAQAVREYCEKTTTGNFEIIFLKR